jgi:type I restriction enzyme R subunit
LAQRLAHKKPYLNLAPELQLNILVVVWQMLTGYDSKWVNTLYLDKELRNEHLIQAFSRTNRLNGIDKQNGIIRYYRYPHSMRRNVDDAFKLYSGDKPYDLFVLKLPDNLQGLNQTFIDIRELFEGCGIENFERLPDGQADRAMFAKCFQDLNKFLYASRLQGFAWDNLNPTMPDGSTIEVLIDEETYNILLQRYHELAMGGRGGSEDIPYDIDTQISELATGKINTDYMNANFTKYVRSLQANDPTEEQQKILNSLHKSFATLSQEEQAYANVFLTDFLNGDIQLEEGKSFHDYIVEYQTRARDNRTQRFADALGLDAELLRDAMRNVFSESDITNALLKPIKDSMDLDKAKSYIEAIEGEPVPKRKVVVKVDELIRQFILQGGFEIEVPSSYEDMEFELSMAAEGFEYYKLTPTNHGIIDIFGGDDSILVGCYKTKKHFEWIKANNLYNIRLGARKGSLENEQTLLERTTFLVLYNVDKPSNVLAYKIIGHQEMTGKELMEIGYPNPNAGKRYMTFRLSPSSIDLSRLEEEKLIERLVGDIPNHINGAPVIIEP